VSFTVPNPSRVWGIDISGRWDGNVDFTATKQAGATFAIIKCVDGTVPTRLWKENRIRAYTAGLAVGEYAWLYRDANVPCRDQARAAWELIKNEPKQIPIAIDFEWTKYMGAPADPNYSDLDKWVTEFTRLSGYKPGFYSAMGYMNDFGVMPLTLRRKFAYFWVASYGGPLPSMPVGFAPEEWNFWQFSSTGEAEIIAPNDTGKMETDLNYWNGDKESFRRFFSLGEVPTQPPPPTGGTMKGTVLLGYTLNIRRADNNEVIGSLRVNDVVYGEVTNNRIYYNKIYRANGTIETPGSMCSSAISNGGTPAVYWMRLESVVEPPPTQPPVVTFPPEIGLTIGGVTKAYIPKP
jgi:GH25 family lysozyme M1 (1,4-beta-N-acetylmuramidase)